MCNFANIHNHTDVGSFDSILTATQFVNRIKSLDQKHVVQTDHGTIKGMVQLANKARENGLKYIPGIEFYLTLGDKPKKENDALNRRYYHMLLIAKNKKGLENLFSLLKLSYRKSDNHFYYKPRAALGEIAEYSEGLIATTGCIASPLSQICLLEAYGEKKLKENYDPNLVDILTRIGISCDDYYEQQLLQGTKNLEDILDKDSAPPIPSIKREEFGLYSYKNVLSQLVNIFGDNLYGEIQDCGEADQEIVNDSIRHHCKELGIPVVATSDAHYASPEEAKLREMMLRIRHGQLDMSESNEFYEGGRLHLKSAKELGDLFGEEPLNNTIKLVESCEDIMFENPTMFPIPVTYKSAIETLCEEGLKFRGFQNNQEYKDRVKEELDVIVDMRFDNYFIVLKEILDLARKENIPIGPGRGSAAGCLIAYLLNITQIDPIKYGLYFSRFLNKSRVSPPDIDIDCSSEDRDYLIEKIQNLYGPDHVCQIMTYSLLKPKGIARDMGRILGDNDLGEEVAKLIPPPLFGKEPTVAEALEQEPLLSEEKYSSIVEPMKKLESLCRTTGVHAGGVVIGPKPLEELIPLEIKDEKGKEKLIAQLSMNEIETAGLIKYDFLGLRNLAVIQLAINNIPSINDIYKDIPIDDKDTFEHLSTTNDYGGIFQFEGSLGIGSLLKQIHPESIEDIAVATALFRPGPLGAGMDQMYLEKRSEYKNGKWKAKDKYQKVLVDTFGTLVYQEQILKICKEIAGFDEATADNVRRAIGKKKRDLMDKYKEDFINGCIQISGLSKSYADRIWFDIEKNADYGFNLSHAVSYGYLSYITAYLRCHHKLEYMTALLNASYDNKLKFLNAMKTCKNLGIKIKPPRLSRLTEDCFVEGDSIRLGTKICKNLKNAGKLAIKAAKKNPKSVFQFIGLLDRSKFNVRMCKTMVQGGLLDEFLEHENLTGYNRADLACLVEAYYEWYKENSIKQEQWDRWNERKEQRAEQEKLKAEGKDYGKRLVSVGKEPTIPEKPTPSSYLNSEIDWFEQAIAEYEILGYSIQNFPSEYLVLPSEVVDIQDINSYIEDMIADGELDFKAKYKVAGVITQFKEKRTRSQKQMANFYLEDKTGIQELTIFPAIYGKIKATSGKPEDFKVAICDITVRVSTNLQGEPQADYILNAIEYPTVRRKSTLTSELKSTYQDDIVFDKVEEFSDFLKTKSHLFSGSIKYKRILITPKGDIINVL